LQRQILPDGGPHLAQIPARLVETAQQDLLPLRQDLRRPQTSRPPPGAFEMRSTRMMPMLRFLPSTATAALRCSTWHEQRAFGSGGHPARLWTTPTAVPMAEHVPHTGFQRLDAGTTTVIMDTGPAAVAECQPGKRTAGCLLVRIVFPDRAGSSSIAALPSNRPRQLAQPLRAAPRHIRP